MAAIRGFRDLQAYQEARRLAKAIFDFSQGFPRSETYSLTDQVRRSSRAVAAMIAEAWARRIYPAAFVAKLNEAMAEANETQCWLDHALDCGYVERDRHRELDERVQHVGAMLQRMIDRADSFCTPRGDP